MGLAALERTPLMRRWIVILVTLFAPFVRAADLLIVIGAPGEEDYAEVFAETAQIWREVAQKADLTITEIEHGRDGLTAGDQWKAALARSADPASLAAPLWIVYIGHGSYDLRLARFNLHGPDVSVDELREWLEPVQRPLVFVHGGSASAPLINAISGPNRIVITATESGQEVNYARFGPRFARTVADDSADIDRDGQTSLLEAFVTAAEQTQAFYLENNRLATEHALIDDNGDRRGTPYDFFNGTRLIERPSDASASPDGNQARLLSLLPSAAERALSPEQRTRRAALEAEVETLRAQKGAMTEDDYFAALERVFRQLAAVYESGDE